MYLRKTGLWLFLVGVVFLALLFLLLYLKFSNIGYLTFSDSAKFADIARNIISGVGYGSTFSFGIGGGSKLLSAPIAPSLWVPPLMPVSIAILYKIFGISDFSVIATSSFYFVMLVVFTYLLARKIFGDFAGILSAVAVAASVDLLKYATTGAIEPLFAFEIVASTYFMSIKRKWATYVAILFAILMYFTRPQAFIYIAGLILYWLLLTFKTKRAFLFFGIALGVGFLVDYFLLSRLAGKYFLYSIIGRGIGTITQVTSGGSTSDSLRGAVMQSGGLITSIKKLLYNLYNFYKLASQIVNPYLLALFVVAFFRWGKDRVESSLKISVIFTAALTLVVTALSIPFFRYIHPVVPLIYVIAIGTLVWIVRQISEQPKFYIPVSFFLIFVFIVAQTLGVIFLDSRFFRNTYNVGKPPVYVALSGILKENTTLNQVVVTNLDTWGSWYGERKTVWFPLEPKQLIDPKTGKIPFNAIYLTSYLIDDQNYYMGRDWRQIFNSPTDSGKWLCDGCGEIAKEFTLKGVYAISPPEDYERQEAKAVLLIKK